MKRILSISIILVLFSLILSGCSSKTSYIRAGESRNASSNHTNFNYSYHTNGEVDTVVVTVQNVCQERIKLLWHILSFFDKLGNQIASGIKVEHTITFISLDDGQIGFILYKWKHDDEIDGVNVSLKTQLTAQQSRTALSGVWYFSADSIRFSLVNNEKWTQNFLRVYIILYNQEGAFDIIHYDASNLLSGELREIVIPLSKVENEGITGITGVRIVANY